MKKTFLVKSAAALAIAVSTAGNAYASTIDFGSSTGNFSPYSEDGYSFNSARLVAGNCLTGSCLALNSNEATVMSSAGGMFTLDSLSFALQGQPSVLTIFDTNDASKNISFSLPATSHGITYYTVSFGSLFSNVTSITFAQKASGNVRIDNIEAVSQVPLPATSWLLGSSLIGLAGMYRKRAITQLIPDLMVAS